ncbi:hypothetical protein P175DRAFT_0464402 [Aspergillus ochraceoroseus IBT 24754]|uniref:Uncharacterized protein n=1 Tax=Aspergillus ochraceoroseus IBT 24754 TaxID=1392256 RepID=A0A2T5LNX6_9EURO|nr:uncharacterized protein P175DRAFT_0464402 [Aspergillus ochraceoroseus IBT 24754]PTU17988.1 hypothetical protein P175DRAFT_0464402 [Aspergillus ochraceoroseus IBT 24754]
MYTFTMLLRPLAVIAALYLSSCAASPGRHRPRSDPSLIPNPSHSHSSQPYQLNLTCTECAFSYGSSCGKNQHPPSFLTVEFTAKKTALLVNGDVIFPAPVPMEFHAVRHSASRHEDILLAYALDVMPLPHQPGDFLGDLYRLKLRLLDLQGRPATANHVSVGIVRDADGNIEIVEVQESPHPRRFRHHFPSDTKSKWWHLKTWKAYLTAYWQTTSVQAKPCGTDSTIETSPSSADRRLISHCRHRHNDLASWTGRERNFVRLVRPVILPGLLGMVAGIIACLLGFLAGKIILSVYYFYNNRTTPSRTPDDDVEEGESIELSEKQRLAEHLAERYGDPAPPHAL